MFPGVHAVQSPDKPAVILANGRTVVTYRQLADRSAQLARHWWNEGLRPGDHVAMLSENNHRFHEVYWAALRSGLYLTPINRFLSSAEAGYILDDSGAKSLVLSGELAHLGGDLQELASNCKDLLLLDGSASGFADYEQALDAHAPEPLDAEPRGALMCYSSGTTGQPKGVQRPLSGLAVDDPAHVGKMGLFLDVYGMDSNTCYLSPAPLYHAAPLAYSGAVHAVGGTVVVMEKFDAEAALQAIDRYGVTHSQWVPTMFVRMLKLPAERRDGFDLSSHQCAIHAAAPCPVEIKEQMIDWWGPIIWEYFAGTESNGITLIGSQDWLEHRGSVGRPLLGVPHICDDDGNELPIGEPGLIYFELDEEPFRYHRDDDKTRSTRHPDHPNWSAIGDIGYLDDEGYLYLTDRKAFMIISGGVNIYPREIEDCLIMHAKVMDVAVFGIPDDEMGERVHAVIQPAAGVERTNLEDELVAFSRERIAHYKIPKSIDFVNELPRSETGKLIKRELQARYTERP